MRRGGLSRSSPAKHAKCKITVLTLFFSSSWSPFFFRGPFSLPPPPSLCVQLFSLTSYACVHPRPLTFHPLPRDSLLPSLSCHGPRRALTKPGCVARRRASEGRDSDRIAVLPPLRVGVDQLICSIQPRVPLLFVL